MDYLLGIDVGTTNTKALVYDIGEGKVVAVGRLPTKTVHPRPGWAEFLPDQLWGGVVEAIRQALAAIDHPERIAAVGVASMGEAGVPIDDVGRCLYPVIAWYDPRTHPQRERWEKAVDIQSLYEVTGHHPRHIYSVFKLMWLRDNAPSVYQAMHKWLCVEDFILWKLTGEFATDYTVASRTMLFDQATRQWSTWAMEQAGIDSRILPPVYPSGAQIGVISAAASSETGLLAGTPVVTGGHDHLCGALAAGIIRPGMALDSTGTAEALLVPTNEFNPNRDLQAGGYSCYCHVVPDTYVVVGGLTASGGLVDWLIEQLWLPTWLPNKPGRDEVYEIAFREAASSPLGARGLFWSPLAMSGTPTNDPSSRAAMIGLTTAHTRGDILRSLLEALGFWLRENLEYLEKVFGQSFCERVVAIGGATSSPLWLQMKADIAGKELCASEVRESVALGAALLAGLGVGIWREPAAAIQHVPTTTRVYYPDPPRTARYSALHKDIYSRLYPSVADINGIIHREFHGVG